MITLEFSEQQVENTHTYELTCTATGGNPFVKNANDTFVNIASPADMLLLPDISGSPLYRDDTIDMIFRDAETRQFTKDNIEEQVGELNEVTLSDQTGTTLYSNVP